MLALSHICPQCGWDLARVRAPRDPVYRMRVAVCPRCSAGSARRKVGAGRKQVFRAVDALSGLMLALIVSASLLIWSSGMVRGLADAIADAGASVLWLVQLRDPTAVNGWDMERVRTFAMFVTLGILSGAWLASALAHWRWWLLLLVWMGLVFAGSSIGELVWAAMWPAQWALGHAAAYGAWGGAGVHEWLERSVLTLVFGAVMLSAAPVGWSGLWLERLSRRRVMRWRRRQLRKERCHP